MISPQLRPGTGRLAFWRGVGRHGEPGDGDDEAQRTDPRDGHLLRHKDSNKAAAPYGFFNVGFKFKFNEVIMGRAARTIIIIIRGIYDVK